MEPTVINPERLKLALERIGSSDGDLWEEFSNAFLASEFPQLRPVGGMHDKGRDAFLYEAADEPGVFLQYSVQEDFRTKVRCTVLDLRANRFELRQLSYCSPQEIIKEADELTGEPDCRLQKEPPYDYGRGVSACYHQNFRHSIADMGLPPP